MRTARYALVVLALLGQVAPACAAGTLYERLGGGPGVNRIVEDAVDIYMSDPDLKPYFDDINAAWLKPRFVAFICKVAGGPCDYHGRDMASAHKGLHVDERAFDRTVEDLQLAMCRNGVPFRVQNQLLARLAPMERQIVTR